jgi:hypothetical protein
MAGDTFTRGGTAVTLIADYYVPTLLRITTDHRSLMTDQREKMTVEDSGIHHAWSPDRA